MNNNKLYWVGLLLYLFSTVAMGQQPVLEWAQSFDDNRPVRDDNNDDYPASLAVDAAGNIYVTGSSQGEVTSDIYVTQMTIIKYSPSGEQLWVAQYEDFSGASDIAVDNAGGVYVTGSSYGDYLTVRYDAATGYQTWAQRYNGPSNDYDAARAIALDNAGGVYVTGSSYLDYATIRYDAATGQQSWVRLYDGPINGNDFATAIVVDHAGGVYVTGRSESETSSDYLTIRYDAATGKRTWKRRYNGPMNGSDFATAIAVDHAGGVYVTGSSDLDYATVRYDAATGQQTWAQSYYGPNSGYDAATSITVDNAGGVYVTGSSTVRYDAATGQQSWVQPHGYGNNNIGVASAIAVEYAGGVYITGYGGGESVTIRYDAISGKQVWIKSYKPEESFLGTTDMALDHEGNVIIAAFFITYPQRDTFLYTIKYSQPPCTPPTPAITVIPTSDVYTGGDPSSIYLGYGPQSVQLVASGGESYTWSPSTGLSITKIADPVFTPTAAGTYTFTVTAYNDACSATASVTIRVVDARCSNGKVLLCHKGKPICISTSAVASHLRNHKQDRLGSCSGETVGEDIITITIPLRVFPNPFRDWANIEFSLPVGGAYRLELYSANGKMLGIVAAGQVQDGQQVQVELRGEKLREGIYYLKLITPDKVQTARLVLKK